MMDAYFLDLDGTLIFSHRYFHDGYMPVESYKESIISYIEKGTYTKLVETIARGGFIPVTSRTKEQYSRIAIFNEHCPHYALLDNGGTLLIDGKEDSDWRKATESLLSGSFEPMYKIVSWASQYADVKVQDGIVIFIKTDKEQLREIIIEGLKEYPDFYWFLHRSKLYVCSRKLTKGAGVRRLIDKYGFRHCVGAGDGDVDFSMIEYVDKFVTNEANKDKISSEKVIVVSEREVARVALNMK